MRKRAFLKSFTLAASGLLFVPRIMAADPVRQRRIASPPKTKALATTPFTYYATNFDGTNDYMLINALSGLADSKLGAMSFWANITGGDSVTQYILSNNSSRFYICRASSNKYVIRGQNSSSSTILSISTSSSYTTALNTGWHHFFSSWDLATAGSGFILVDGISNYAESTFTNGTIDYLGTTTSYTFGAGPALANNIFMDICEFWFNTEYIASANVTKFRNAGTGKPISLGSNGSTPTGNIPLIYLPYPYTSFEVNAGSGGNFGVTGSLTESASKP